MQAKGSPGAVDTEPLIAEAGGDLVGTQKRDQKVAFRIAITGALRQHIRRRASDRIEPIVTAVADLVTNVVETFPGSGLCCFRFEIACQPL